MIVKKTGLKRNTPGIWFSGLANGAAICGAKIFDDKIVGDCAAWASAALPEKK